MTFIVGASAHGSPGVSTALQLLGAQWPNSQTVPVVVEADASGGVLAARYGISLTPGMVTLAESLRKGEQPALLDHAQRLPSGVACVPISPSATASSAQLRSALGFLGPYLQSVDHTVMLDAGTVLPDSRLVSSMAAADLLLWFVRPNREELLVLRHRLSECSQPDDVAIVLVGDSPYKAAQVEHALDVPVIGVVPVDNRGAAAVNAGGDDRFLRRSPLTRACAKLAEQLQHHVWMRAVSDADEGWTSEPQTEPEDPKPESEELSKKTRGTRRSHRAKSARGKSDTSSVPGLPVTTSEPGPDAGSRTAAEPAMIDLSTLPPPPTEVGRLPSAPG